MPQQSRELLDRRVGAEYTETMLRVVCAVVENAEGELLLCQRPEGKSQAGLWEFPGGKIEPGESERSALQRELLEELGCGFTIGEALEAVVHKYDEFIIKLLPYRCSLISGQYPRALEHQAIEWVALAAFQNYQLAPADLPIVEQLMGGEIA